MRVEKEVNQQTNKIITEANNYGRCSEGREAEN